MCCDIATTYAWRTTSKTVTTTEYPNKKKCPRTHEMRTTRTCRWNKHQEQQANPPLTSTAQDKTQQGTYSIPQHNKQQEISKITTTTKKTIIRTRRARCENPWRRGRVTKNKNKQNATWLFTSFNHERNEKQNTSKSKHREDQVWWTFSISHSEPLECSKVDGPQHNRQKQNAQTWPQSVKKDPPTTTTMTGGGQGHKAKALRPPAAPPCWRHRPRCQPPTWRWRGHNINTTKREWKVPSKAS